MDVEGDPILKKAQSKMKKEREQKEQEKTDKKKKKAEEEKHEIQELKRHKNYFEIKFSCFGRYPSVPRELRKKHKKPEVTFS